MTIHYCARCARALAADEGVAVQRRVPLTRYQRRLYDYVATFIDRMGYAPSFEEIAAKLQYKSLATVHEHLSNLERKGWITREYNTCRSITLVEPRGETAEVRP